VIDELESAGLLGRGGAGFPVGRKWRSIAVQRGSIPVVMANGAEGEPESFKDRVLMAHRPHLVLDGALLAARVVGADRIELYLGREHTSAIRAMRAAIGERLATEQDLLHVVEAPVGYVAGEATAAVHYINGKDARPSTTPPRMSERGVRNRPTLVQNVESLAHAALIARFGAAWFRQAGHGASRGTALITIGGAVRDPGVLEIELGTPLSEVVARAGGASATPQAVLVGGYFGSWATAADVWEMSLDPEVMKCAGLSIGCGMIGLLGAHECGVARVSSIIAFLAAASADQCGPCRFGLPAIAAAVKRLAVGRPNADDLDNVVRWTDLVRGRGACRHPDGAAQQISSALGVFATDFETHLNSGRCVSARVPLGAA
jgi:NADH:ubiquinone oxidoreductase subunit F (NADH-binding)